MVNKFYIDNTQVNSDFHCSWQNLPKVQCYKDITVHYRMGSDGGFFFDDKRCIMQMQRSGKICTVTVYNDGGFIDTLHGNYHLSTSFLNRFDKYFNVATPAKIRERYPLLNKMLEHETSIPSLSFYCFKDLGASFCILRGEPIREDRLSESQLKLILSAVDCVLEIEQEYESFKETMYFKALEDSYKKLKPKSDKVAASLTVVKLVYVGLRIFNLGGSNGGDFNGCFDGDISLDNVDLSMDDALSQLDANPTLVDYFVSPADASIDSSCSDGNIDGALSPSDYVSFTGNSDNAQQIASLQSDLNAANRDIDYYTREIRNFTDGTSNTYRANCTSALNRATQKAADVASKIQQLKK